KRALVARALAETARASTMQRLRPNPRIATPHHLRDRPAVPWNTIVRDGGLTTGPRDRRVAEIFDDRLAPS
ncbi:MAG: hypothetical protein O2895_04865, partial [Chloroflexi bacterium]|nr:hypothetical protein [Chloroflexota bacterium]